MAVSEITFFFKSLLLGSWALRFQKSWVVETGSPSPPPLPPQRQFQGFLSVPIQVLGPSHPHPLVGLLALDLLQFCDVLLTPHPPALHSGGIGSTASRGRWYQHLDRLSPASPGIL